MWEYAVLMQMNFLIGIDEWNYVDGRSRWVLTTKTSNSGFELNDHPKFKKLFFEFQNAVAKKTPHNGGTEAANELIRLLDDNELRDAIITGLRGEDDLDVIRRAAAMNWETTGRTPGSNQIMIRRKIE